MAIIDNIVNISITRQTAQVDIASFSVPLLLVEMDDAITAFTSLRVKSYTDIEDVATDLGATHSGYIMAQKLLGGQIKPSTFKIAKVNKETGDEETYADAINAVLAQDDEWYAVMAESHLPADIEAVSDIIQATRKMYFTSTSSADALNSLITTDIGSKLKAKSNDRTVIMYSPTADTEFPECAWVGTQIVEVPGSNTWEYKRLNGVTVNNLSMSNISVLEDKGYNYYITIKGVPVTRRGKTAESEWVDVMILVDWIYARMQEQIFFRLINTKKIAFTQTGLTMIENEIRSVLSQAQANGGVDTYTVNAPRVLSIPEMQRAARTAGDFTFEARLQGAVSTVIIRGVVSS